MTAITPSAHLREFIDEVYSSPDGADPLGVLPPLFTTLRRHIHFSSAIYLRIDPNDWTVTIPYAHDFRPDLIARYTEHYYRVDPYFIHAPQLKRPNEAVRMSDFVDVGEVQRGEFGVAMHLADFAHGMAIGAFVRGQPVGGFALHRSGSKHDFDRREQSIFQWFISVAAKAMDYRGLVAHLHRPHPATMVVAPDTGRVVALSEQMYTLLLQSPQAPILTVPADSQHQYLWRACDRTYSVRSTELDPTSLLNSDALANIEFNADPDFTRGRVRILPGASQRRAVVFVEALDTAERARGSLSGFGLSRRQEQVALLIVLGKGPKEIARECGISVNTAKEYAADVYQRLGVHTRAAFLAKLTGAAN